MAPRNGSPLPRLLLPPPNLVCPAVASPRFFGYLATASPRLIARPVLAKSIPLVHPAPSTFRRGSEGIDKRSGELKRGPPAVGSVQRPGRWSRAVICVRSASNALMDSTSFLSRADLASHLKVSLRSVDRFVSRHDLRSGPGRPVLVPLSSYASCLVSLRRESTRSMTPAPAVQRDAPRARPVGPGEELVLVAQSAGFNPARAARGLRTPDPAPNARSVPGWHWGWSIVEAAQAMAGVLEAMAHRASRPEPEGESRAARYLREFLARGDGEQRNGARRSFAHALSSPPAR